MVMPFRSAMRRHVAAALVGLLLDLAFLVAVGAADVGSLLAGLLLPVAALVPGIALSSLVLTRLAGRGGRLIACPLAAAAPGFALGVALMALRGQDPSAGPVSAGEALSFAAWLALWPALTALVAAWGGPSSGQAGSARSLASR